MQILLTEAAGRQIRVPDNAHLNMFRQVIEKRHPAVGMLSIRVAVRANRRVRQFEAGVRRPGQQTTGATS